MTKASQSGNVYLVEHYAPGLTVDGLGCWAARVRETAVAMGSEGRAVRYLRSTIVPADEALLCVFEAGSEELVREVYARSGVPFERLSVAIADESEWLDARSPSGAGGAEQTAQQQTERELRASGIADSTRDARAAQEKEKS
ncbi:MAG TPA: nickel-binding protein [Propionibacteriaceae bacterium]|jgi:hypothetical protein